MRVYITHQRARSFGGFSYYSAKNGKMAMVSHLGRQWWLGHVIPHGFYLCLVDPVKPQRGDLQVA